MKQSFHILSNTQEQDQQALSIRIGEKHMGFAITSASADELYQLNWYAGEETNRDSLQDFYTHHPALQRSFIKTNVCYDFPQSVLVPSSHYHEEDAQTLLQTMYGIPGKDAVLTETVSNWQMKNVYAIPQEVKHWTEQFFGQANAWHAYTIAVQQIESTDFEGSLVADFRTDDFTLVVSKANKLLLTQTFPYATPADVLYYLLKTCQEFSFSQENLRLSLSGLIDKESSLYRELYQYFIHVRFRDPLWFLTGAEQTYPLHFFTSLNDLARCGS